MALIPPVMQSSYEALFEWRKTFVEGSTSLLAATTAVPEDVFPPPELPSLPQAAFAFPSTLDIARYTTFSAVLRIDPTDIAAANGATFIFRDALDTIFQQTGLFPVAAKTEWDLRLIDLGTEFAVINALTGSRGWRLYSRKLIADNATLWNSEDALPVLAGVVTDDVQDFLKVYQARMQYVLALAEVDPQRI
ncbi:MAG: hypothetical protein V3R81_07815 [Gammaproteobacteria bacterium]